MNAKVRVALMAGCLAGGLSLTGCKEEEKEEFGFTCIELQRGSGASVNDPFVGTHKILATLDYQPCLIDYYVNKHPEMRLNGKEGPAVFAEWKDRLCSEDIDRRIDCEVEDFKQTIQQTGTQVYQMGITYVVPNAEQIEGRRLLWGPGPLPDAAECQDGLQPYASLTSLSGVIGLNKDGQTIWSIQSFSNQNGIMQLTGGGCIRAFIQRSGG